MNKEEILELINAGFAPELIELEFNVPLEKINKYIKQEQKRQEEAKKAAEAKKQEEARLAKEKLARKKAITDRTRNQEIHAQPNQTKHTTITRKSKQNTLDVLRKNYKQLVANSIPESPTQPSYTLPTESEIEKINQVIEELKTKSTSISQMQPSEKKEKRTTLLDMFKQLDTISSLPKTLEQLTELGTIFQSSNLENLAISHDDKINLKLRRVRKNLTETLGKLIEQMANQTSDLDELTELSKKLPALNRSSDSFLVDSIKNRITFKISQLKTAQTMYNIRNKVSPEIEAVITSIADNTFDLESAKEAISKEAQRRVDAAPKTQFALTKERQITQVEIQIRTIIAEQGKKYPITNPGAAMNNLMTLFSERDKESSFSRVIENLTSQGKYDEAKDLCSKYIVHRSFDTEEPSMSKKARQLHKNTTLTQIGNMVMEQIEKPSNPEEDEIFMSLLEERMDRERITPKQIIIGTTASGGKKLTLNDIWYTNTRLQK